MRSQQPNRRNWSRWSLPALLFTLALGAVACGDDAPPRPDAGPVVDAGPVDAGPVDAGPTDAGPKEIPPASLADCDDSSSFQTVLAAAAAQPGGGGGGGGLTEFTIHYQRKNGDYEGWQVHTWGIAVDPGWNNGHNPVSTTPANGFITFKVPLNASTGELGYLFHKGETKDHDAQDQKFLVDGTVSEIWRIEGDSQTYTSAPTAPQTPDITRVRVTYQRFDKAFDKFGLHLWEGSGVDVSALSGVAIGNWDNPVPFSSMPGYAAAADGASVSFDIPILNPKTNASYTKLEFIIHGTSAAPGGTGNKDGWSNNIAVDYLALSGNAADGAGKIWLVQETAEVFYAQPDLAQVSTTDMKAYWLTQDLIKWPRVDAAGSFKLYTSTTGQLVVAKGQAVKGHDGALELEVFTGTVPEAAATRFKFVPPGVVLKAKALRAALAQAHTRQLVLAQLDAAGKVLNATVAQTPGALDELYAKAHSGETEVKDLGVKVGSGTTAFKVWAPTAQRVAVCVYDSGSGAAAS
ncbi:MAG TPA: pullulanase-associated domain-containing protein, partial [Aggregicoccus sp.]|nr:pullulanase-associated domain-containing protein [Aggregicoccus sp.]